MEKSEEQPQVQDLVGELLAEVAEKDPNLAQQVCGLPEHLGKVRRSGRGYVAASGKAPKKKNCKTKYEIWSGNY